MKSVWSRSWKKSKQPRKQRKYVYNAPLHIRHKFLSAHLSKELIKKYNKRSIPLRKGDKVKIVRGQFKGKGGKIENADPKKLAVNITGIEKIRRDGGKSFIPIKASNIVITELNLEDKKREEKLKGKIEGG